MPNILASTPLSWWRHIVSRSAAWKDRQFAWRSRWRSYAAEDPCEYILQADWLSRCHVSNQGSWLAEDRQLKIKDRLLKIVCWRSSRLIWRSYMCIFYKLRLSWVKRHSDWFRYQPIRCFFLHQRRVPFQVLDVPRIEQFRTFPTNKTLESNIIFRSLILAEKNLSKKFS